MWDSLVGAVVGAGISGAVTWCVFAGEWRNQKGLAKQQAAAELEGFLGAIEAEMTILWERYATEVAAVIEALPPGEIFDFQWPARRDYFTVYTANAHRLGRVEDAELRRAIVRTYTLARGMVDSLDLNGEMLREMHSLFPRLENGSDAARQQHNALDARLRAYAGSLKQGALALRGCVEDLLGRLASRPREGVAG